VSSGAPTRRSRTAPLRLAVGLGDPERERRILPALDDAGEVRVVERCLTAEQLRDAATGGQVDALLFAFDLHRLARGLVAEIDQVPLPQVLLVPDPEDPRWQGLHAVVLPTEAEAELVRAALAAAVRGERLTPPTRPAAGSPPAERAVAEPDAARTSRLSVISVGSGAGSPGRSLVAVNLATALGAVAPTALLDADLAGPSLAAQLDADPSRNLYMVAHAEPDAPWEWERAIAAEVQPLDRRSPYGVVLCGLPRRSRPASTAPATSSRASSRPTLVARCPVGGRSTGPG
jgi:hypothetical protein